MPSPSSIKFSLLTDTGLSDTDKITSSGIIEVLGLETGPSNTWQYSLDYGKTWSSKNPVASTVPGVKVELFEGIGFTGTQRSTRTETTINFPDSYDTRYGGNGDTFSLRLSGQIQAYTTGSNTFKVGSDDGVRVWVNGQLVVDSWRDRGTTFDTFSVPGLTKGEWYDLKIEYYENGGGAALQLKNIDDTFVTALRSNPIDSSAGANPTTIGRNLIDLPAGVYADGQVRVRQQIVQALPKENLIQNGSFEEGWVGNGWTGLTSLPGWKTADRFEIWGKSMTPASDGNYLLEIDYAGALDQISQAVTTVKDATYSLQFDMKSRGGGNESLEVYWRGEMLSTVKTASQNWTTFKFDIKGSGSSDELIFKELQSENNGLGSLIDNVRLNVFSLPQASTSVDIVPEEFSIPFKVTVDKIAPVITLNQIGGLDKILSASTSDRLVTGKAEAGTYVTLKSNITYLTDDFSQMSSSAKIGGSAALSKGELILTPVANSQLGYFIYDKLATNPTSFTARFDYRTSDGSGADGTSFNFGKIVPEGYYEYGIANTGLVVSFLEYGNDRIAVKYNNKVINTTDIALEGTSYRQFAIAVDNANKLSLSIDGKVALKDIDLGSDYANADKSGWQFGFGSRTGGATNKHSIDNFSVAGFEGSLSNSPSSASGLGTTIASNILVNNEGTFSYALTNEQLKLLGEGSGKSLIATASDLAGNTSKSNTVGFAVDTEVTPVSITSIGGGDGKVSNQVVETGKGALKFNLDQYTGYWSNKLSDLQNYAERYNPATSKNKYSIITDAIDFTDDKGGFAGELKYDRRWPAAEALNVWGTGGINDKFFVKVSGDFSIEKAGLYRFRTYNDDGVFLLVNGNLVINDPTLHPEQVFTGDINLAAGNHQLELFFFENGGEASLEFSVSAYDSARKAWGAYQLMGQDSSIKAKSIVDVDNLIEGKGEALSTVYLKVGDIELGSVRTKSDGTFQYRMTDSNLALLAGNPNGSPIVAYQYDSAGNLSSSQAAIVAPSEIAPIVLIQSIGQVDKVVSTKLGGNLITGTGNANLSTTIVADGKELGKVFADSNGLFKYELTKENIDTVGQGSAKSILAQQKSASGLVGTSTAFGFAVDTIAPVLKIDKIGSGDGRISRKNNLISGTAETDIDIIVKSGGQELGRTRADSKGNFQLALSTQALELLSLASKTGPFKITAEQTDAVGNVGKFESSPTTAKLSPPVVTISGVGGNDAVVSSQIADLSISGRAEAGSAVSLWYNNILLGQTTPANDKGDFTYSFSSADLKTLGQGSGKTITFKQKDNFENEGSFESQAFSIDTVAPSLQLPSKASSVGLGGVDGVMSTQFGDTVLRGKGEASLNLDISFNGHTRRVSSDSSGDFAYTFDSNDIQLLGQGNNKQIVVSQADNAGNKSNLSLNVNVDTIAAAPSFFLADTGSSSSDRITKSTWISLLGIEKGASWQYSIDSGNSWSAAQSESTSSFAIASGVYSHGQIQAKQIDVAGNNSEANISFAAFTVDTNAAAPTLFLDDTGSSSSDRITKSTTISVNGVEADATWQYSIDSGKTWSTVQMASTTSFLIDPGLYTAGQVRVKQTDVAGNNSVANISFAGFTVDTTAAIAPSLKLLSDTGSSSSDRMTNNATISVAAIEAGATWQYSIDYGYSWSIAQPASTTSFSISDGVYMLGQVQVMQTDIAGNSSGANTSFDAFSIDTTAAAPTLSLEDTGSSSSDRITNSTTISVVGVEEGATWQYSIDSGKTWSNAQQATTKEDSYQQQEQLTLSGIYESGDVLNVTIDGTLISYIVQAKDLTVDGNGGGGTATADQIRSTVASRMVAAINSTATLNSAIRASSSSSQINVSAINYPFTLTAVAVDLTAAQTGSGPSAITNLTITPNKMEFDVDVVYSSALEAFSGWSSADQLRIHSGNNVGDYRQTTDWISDGSKRDGQWFIKPGTFTNLKVGESIVANRIDAPNSDRGYVDGYGIFSEVADQVLIILSGRAVSGDRIQGHVVIDLNDPTYNDTGAVFQNYATTPWTFSLGGRVLQKGVYATPSSDKSQAVSVTSTVSNVNSVSDTLSSFLIAAGTYSTGQVQVKQTDAAGNHSVPNTSFAAFNVDTTAAAPTLSLEDTGSSSNDRITKSTSISVVGVEEGATWQYSIDSGKTWSTAQAASTTSFSIDAGVYTAGQVQVMQTDLAGNSSEANTSFAGFTIDTIAAAAPSLFLVDTGSSSSDRITNSMIISIDGVESGATWQYSIDSGFSWSIAQPSSTTSFSIASGFYTAGQVQVKQTDLAGNSSEANTSFEAFTVDTTAAAAPLLSLVDTGSSSTDRITNSSIISIDGVETDATWQYSIDSGNSWSTVQQASTPFFSLLDGSYTTGQVRVKQTDVAGNTSAANTSFAAFTVDTIAPAISQIRSIATDAIVSSNPNDNLVMGLSDSKSTVSLLVNGNALAKIQSDSKGQFSYVFSNNDIASIGQGTFNLQAIVSDLAGNVTFSDLTSFKVDTLAPIKPVITSIGGLDRTVSTKGSGNVTQTVDNLVIGNAEAGSKVQFFSESKLLGTSIADDYGNFSYGLNASNVALYGQGKGKLLRVVSVDTAGNASASSAEFQFNVDTIAPSSPKIVGIGGIDGVLSSVQDDNKIIGVAEAGSSLELRATGTGNTLFSISGLFVDSKGNWNYSFTKEQLNTLKSAKANSISTFLQAISSDAAGNESSSVAFTPILDLDAPDLRLTSVGGIDAVISGKSGDNLIIGSGDPDRTVSIVFNGKTLGTVKSDKKGVFAYSLTSSDLRSIGEGQNKQLMISQSDMAGNLSNMAISFAVDITAPNIPLIQSIGGFDKTVSAGEFDRIVRGTGEAGSSLELLLVSGTKLISMASIKVDKNGEFSYILTPENLTQIGRGVGKSIVAVCSDAAGNTSTSKPFSFGVEALWQLGSAKNDTLSFSSTVDVLTGLTGADRFVLPSLTSCLISGGVIPSFDRLTDFQIGVDQIDAPNPIAAGMSKDLGTLQTLSTLNLSQLLNSVSFTANSSAVFRYEDSNMGQRTFLALNDNNAGFDSKRDAIIEITGFSGNLSALSVI